MLVPFKNSKSYGVIHTENYFSFLGFSKKVNSDEIQKVDIYLDDMLIDTITADKHIEKIEDIYELESFGFEYVLPNEYIGQKSLISFKNHETKEYLQNSPYELIQENHPKFNEYRFLHSLSFPLNKLKNLYCRNNVGFLATEKNIENNSYVNYIKKLVIRFPKLTYNAFCFNADEEKLIKEIFSDSVKVIFITDIAEIIKHTEYYLSSEFNTMDIKVLEKLKSADLNILPLSMNLGLSHLSLEEWENLNKTMYNLFFENIDYFGFCENDIKKYNFSFHMVFYNKMMEKYDISLDFNLNMSVSEAYVYLHIQLGFKNHNYISYLNEFMTKYKWLISQNEFKN